MKIKPIVVITVKGGLVQEVNASTPVDVFVEDWDCPPDKPLVIEFSADELTRDQMQRISQHGSSGNAASSMPSAQPLPIPFDNYEIQPCRRFFDPEEPDIAFVEPCEPFEADFWTLYGHIPGKGVQAIGDFDTREHAEEVFCRITGLAFNISCTVNAHIRIMHSGQKLLQAAEAAWRRAANHERLSIDECNELCAAIAEATGRAA